MIFPKLLKLFFKENFSLKRLFGFNLKQNKVKAGLIAFALIYALVTFVGMFGFLFYDLGRILNEMNQVPILLGFLGFYSIGLSTFIVFFRASGSLFYYKDFEIIAPLPIHSRTVFIAKLTVLMLMLYIMSFLATGPIVFSYFYWNGFDLVSFIIYIIAMFFIPLVPVIFISFLSLLMAILTSKIRGSKIINLILMFALFLGIFAFSFSLNSVDSNPLTGQIDLFAGLRSSYPPLGWFIDAIAKKEILPLIYLILSHGALFALFIVLVFPLVNFTNKRGIRSNIKKHHKAINYHQQHIMVSLIKKELSKFFNITLYALNAGLGPVILVIASVASIFYKSNVESILADMIGTGLEIELLLMVFLGFSISMTYTSSISLSLEGKNFWVLKSLPIKAETIMYAKVLFNVLLIGPIAVFSILLFGYSMSIAFVNQLLLILLVLGFTFAVSFMDAVFNLYVPKFDYINDVEVIKQSASALLGIFGGFALIALHGVFYYFVNTYFSLSIMLVFLSLISILLASLFWWIVKTQSEKLFRKM
jgi:ABC-2 type transport system permease protein